MSGSGTWNIAENINKHETTKYKKKTINKKTKTNIKQQTIRK
jgi:hypothetical protein